MKHQLFAAISALASAVTARPAAAAAACDRATLVSISDSYVAAQAAGLLETLKGVDANTVYTQNFKTATLASGLLSQSFKIDHNRSTHDTTQCATYTELSMRCFHLLLVSLVCPLLPEFSRPFSLPLHEMGRHHTQLTQPTPAQSSPTPRTPHVVATQIRLSPNSTAPTISKIETIVTSTGDWLFNAPATLRYASQESWGEIPEAQRDTREAIQAAADAYLDLFNDKSVKVPWGSPCARLEGGSYVQPRCDVGVPSGVRQTNRRYVVDEVTGAVDVFFDFAGADPDSHEFRVEGASFATCIP
ncbi:hypothetical protein PG997_013013 [Apiospora hydei]|uniref:DUF8021 domain-containing protein n=1 Tax=Apiospora hydei TaxID=1337664 RepID=A0ABR1V512_9PEZI